MKRWLFLLTLLIWDIALAGTAQVSWTNATLNDDGTTIPASGSGALASTVIENFQCANAASTWPATPASVTIPIAQLGTTITGMTNGLLYCFRAKHVTVGGVSSLYSGVATKLMPVPNPNPPGNLTIGAVSTAAYKERIGGTPDAPTVAMVPIGTIPLGTPCIGTVERLGYFAVPRSAVTKTNSFDTLPFIVYGQCS